LPYLSVDKAKEECYIEFIRQLDAGVMFFENTAARLWCPTAGQQYKEGES